MTTIAYIEVWYKFVQQRVILEMYQLDADQFI